MRDFSYGKRDRGPIEFGTRIAEKEREIMKIARKNVITVPPTMSIKNVAETMIEYNTRRLPIVQPGNRRLQGIIITRDIIDFLGGGEKYNLIKNKHKGNFLSAINDSVKEIMSTDVISIPQNFSVGETLNKLSKENVGGFPILNKKNRVVGIVEEEDFIYNIAGIWSGITVKDTMSKKIITITPGFSIGDTCRLMIKNYIRRIPVVSDDELIGIVTTLDIINYFGSSQMLEQMKTNRVDEALEIKISKIINNQVLTISPLEDIGKAIEKMKLNNMGFLTVMKNGKLEGVITERDILMKLLKED